MKINTALILCAGYGKRLNPLTLSKPKPLLKINEVTLLENSLNLVQDLGIKKVILNTFYLKEQISDFIIKNKFKLEIKIVEDGKNILNTGGGILNLINSSKEKDFLIINPDTLWNNKYKEYIYEMARFYFSNEIKNILLLVKNDLSFDKSLKGDFDLIKNKIIKSNKNNYIYTGCQIINRKLFGKFSTYNFPISEVWNELIKENQLYGYESLEHFQHISSIEIFEELSKNW